MKSIGTIVFTMGMFIILGGIFFDKEISVDNVKKINDRVTILAWGIFISLIGLVINLYKEMNKWE